MKNEMDAQECNGPELLLTDWHEELGPVVIEQSLGEIHEPAELLATQSYVSAQNVFSSEEFARITFSIPQLKIRRKARIYFDVVEDETVRGGRRPFMLVAFFPLDFADANFDVLDPLVAPVLDNYKKGVVPNLSSLRNSLAKKMGGGQSLGAAIPPPPQSSTTDGGELSEQRTRSEVNLKVFCSRCSREIEINLTGEVGAEEGVFHTYTNVHGFDDPNVEPHGLRVKTDAKGRLVRVEMVDADGEPLGGARGPIVRKVGPWSKAEVALLRAELASGDLKPAHALAEELQRTVKDVEKMIDKLLERAKH
ncbi:MAG: hypothetical protein Kow0069_11700 [Promethearchaeota archaeon]